MAPQYTFENQAGFDPISNTPNTQAVLTGLNGSTATGTLTGPGPKTAVGYGPAGSLADYEFGPQATPIQFQIGGTAYTGAANFVFDAPSEVFTLTTVDYSVAAAPEPATWLTMIAGFGVAGGALRTTRRRRRQALVAA